VASCVRIPANTTDIFSRTANDATARPCKKRRTVEQAVVRARAAWKGCVNTPLVNAFISYSHRDSELAERLGSALRRAGIATFRYEGDLPLGEAIPAELRSRMGSADYCIVLLTPNSVRSKWVRRELGLAAQLSESGPGRPVIVGAIHGLKRPPEVPLLDFEESGAVLSSIDFAERNCLELDDVSEDVLVQRLRRLTPALTWLSDEGADRRFGGHVLDCYEELFPEAEERDSRADLESWLEEGLAENPPWEPWREYFAALHLSQLVLGVTYVSFHPRSNWCGGSYFGIRRGWRDRDRAVHLLTRVLERVGHEWPDAKGVLFEIQMVDIDLLVLAAACPRLAEFPDQKGLRHNLRTLARLRIYQQRGCRAFVRNDRRPLNVVQPALVEPLGASNERPMILMFKAIHDVVNSDPDPEDVLRFWYRDFYGQSFDGSGSVELPGYVDYVTGLEDRVRAEAIAHGFRLGIVDVPRAAKQLLSRAREEGVVPHLEL
jgi:hypothetical protein